MSPQASVSTAHPFGVLLRQWRTARKMSQFALALEADISARHLSFLETGRAQPSRDMVLLLTTSLDVPLRERNRWLMAAGYAPIYRETVLTAPEMRPAQQALEFVLQQQELQAHLQRPHRNSAPPKPAITVARDSRHLFALSCLLVTAHCQGSGRPQPDELSLVLVAPQGGPVLRDAAPGGGHGGSG